MTDDTTCLANRLLAAEDDVGKIKLEITKLLAQVGGTTPGTNEISDNIATLLTENSKLKYRINLMKRAASNRDKLPVTANDDNNSMYGVSAVLKNLFGVAIRSAYPDVDVQVLIALANLNVKSSKVPDYQCNSALPIFQILKGRGIKIKPSEVAQNIVSALPSHDIISELDIAPAGFINIILNRKEVERLLHLIIDNGVQPPSIIQNKLRVVVDFSSPNIAKEMHVGHLRSTIIGDSICRLLEFLGHDVLRINHVGDWGTQFGMLIAHLQDEFPNYKEVSPSVSDLQAFYRASKLRFDEDPEFKKRAYACVVCLQSFEPDHIKAWNLICEASRKEFQNVYDRLNIVLTERGESFYQKRMEAVVQDLEKRGLLVQEEGRKLLWCEEIAVPYTIVKSDGGFTYDTSDMATIRQRLDEEKGDWLIYVTDSGQMQHFEILKYCAIKAGYMDPNNVRMDHVCFGAVLGEDGKKFKTRSGETVKLVALLDEGLKRARDKLIEKGRDKELTPEELELAQRSIAYGCIKYADLVNNRNHPYVFSFDKMLDDRGNTAVYLLYALTRIRAIARTAGISSEQLQEASKSIPISLDHEKEYKLAKVLLRFSDVLEIVCSTLCLHTFCDFVYEVACTFSEFYNSCYCVEKNESGEIVKVNMGRLLLTEVTARLLERSFHILGLEPVEKM